MWCRLVLFQALLLPYRGDNGSAGGRSRTSEGDHCDAAAATDILLPPLSRCVEHGLTPDQGDRLLHGLVGGTCYKQ